MKGEKHPWASPFAQSSLARKRASHWYQTETDEGSPRNTPAGPCLEELAAVFWGGLQSVKAPTSWEWIYFYFLFLFLASLAQAACGLGWSRKKMLWEVRVSWVALPHIVPGYFSEARSNVDVEEVLKPPVFLNSPCKKRGGWGRRKNTHQNPDSKSLIFKSKCVFILVSPKSPNASIL